MEHHLSIGTLSETDIKRLNGYEGFKKNDSQEKKFTSIEHRKN